MPPKLETGGHGGNFPGDMSKNPRLRLITYRALASLTMELPASFYPPHAAISGLSWVAESTRITDSHNAQGADRRTNTSESLQA